MTTTGIQAVQARIAVIESRLKALAGGTDFASVLDSTVTSSTAMAGTSAMTGTSSTTTVSLSDPGDAEKLQRLTAYMQSRHFNSGLAAETGTFLQAAKANGIDWRLGVAIAVAESSGGRDCFRQNNPFGIMGKSFASWKDAVTEVNRLVASYGYGNDPQKILAKYNPSGGQTYINNVINEMNAV